MKDLVNGIVAEGWDKVQIGMEDENSYSENFCELSLIDQQQQQTHKIRKKRNKA